MKLPAVVQSPGPTWAAMQKAFGILAPPKREPPSKWMEREYVIAAEESAAPGRYSFAHYEYLRQVFDWFSDPTLEMIVLPKAAQIGWTAGFTGFLCSLIDNDPSRILVAMPTQDEAEVWSKDRFEPNIRATPCIREKIAGNKTKSNQSTMRHKRFPGGTLKVVGANSSTGLSSWPAKYGFCDEVDRYPLSAGGEGDPIALVRKRLQTWLRQGGKLGIGSTPKVEQSSIIWHYWQQGDMQRWHCACPHCQGEQLLEWEHVKWPEGQPGEAAYYCPACGAAWTDLERRISVAGGHWKPTSTPLDRKIRSALVDGLLSPHVTVVEMATKWESCESDDQKQAFINLYLGRPWRVVGEAPDWQRLYDRREMWPDNRLPLGALFLTAGVDVQKDRIECRVWAWGRGQQCWLADVKILEGDTSRAEVWERLTEVFEGNWQHETGAHLTIARMGIDSGYATAEVYRWCRPRRGKALAMKGMGTLGQAIGIPNIVEVAGKRKRRGGVRVWPVGPNYTKPILYGALRKERPIGPDARYPKGYVHLPDWVSDQEIRQLVSEELVTETSRLGFSKQVWSIIPGRRNEALDCFVYAYAAAADMGLERMADASWTKYEAALNVESAELPDDRPQSAPVVLQPEPTDRIRPAVAPQPAEEPPTVIVTPKQVPQRQAQTLKLGGPRPGTWFGRR